jgi:hypothetical protein
VGLAKTHGRRGFYVRLLGPLILGSFLYFSTLFCCLCSHFGFLQFFENDDVASINWVLQNTTFTGGPDHRGSLLNKLLYIYNPRYILIKLLYIYKTLDIY